MRIFARNTAAVQAGTLWQCSRALTVQGLRGTGCSGTTNPARRPRRARDWRGARSCAFPPDRPLFRGAAHLSSLRAARLCAGPPSVAGRSSGRPSTHIVPFCQSGESRSCGKGRTPERPAIKHPVCAIRVPSRCFSPAGRRACPGSPFPFPARTACTRRKAPRSTIPCRC